MATAFEGLSEEVARLIDNAEVTQALEAIWERVRRCNQYVEERAPWKLAADESAAEQLDSVLATLCEALRALTVLLAPWLPASAEKLLAALGATDDSYAAAPFGRGSLGAIEKIDPMFPKDTEASS
jgi:methionyl-tRNA synthetase